MPLIKYDLKVAAKTHQPRSIMNQFRQNADTSGLASNTKLEQRAGVALAVIIGLALAAALVAGLAS